MDVTTRQKILYIDDTPEARLLISRLLGREYIVLEAGDPLNGIELARETQPDLVLLDINMPLMSGHEVATRLRTLLPGTPLVALTADVSAGAKERALTAGCAGYITKPINIDTLPEEIAAYIAGKRQVLENAHHHTQEYLSQLVERLEKKVRETTKIATRNAFLNKQNKQMIAQLQRQHRLLEAAARVGKSITSILDLHKLLNTTVDIICEEFAFYYAGIFMLDREGEWAVLRAGYSKAGDAMLAQGHRLEVGGASMIGRAISQRRARITLDVGEERVHFKNPHLPHTRSEMALPLVFQNTQLGALTVQSQEVNAFSNHDVTALQALADQVAVAINNANLLRELDQANKELLRTKTFEAIAAATGETIHWVGNKAAPIPGSINRVREDLADMLAMVQTLLKMPEAERSAHPFGAALEETFEFTLDTGLDLPAIAEKLSAMSPKRLRFLGGLESIYEDLEIVEQSATTILNIKEDLIGPARQQNIVDFDLNELLKRTAVNMGLPEGVLQTRFVDDLPRVHADPMQIDRVFINLIKNAWEALQERENPQITLRTRHARESGFTYAHVADNGLGIPPEILDKIWVTFFTTKGDRGGTGLGLDACMKIITQVGGKIWVDSSPGKGSIFHILLPTESQRAKIED